MGDQITELRDRLDRFEAISEKADKFIEIVRKYTDFSELTAPMLNEFVEKVIVNEAKKINGKRTQAVDIYLNFIGKFEVPGHEIDLTSEEEQDPVEKRRAQWRNYYYRTKEKKQTLLQQQQKTDRSA